MCTNFCNVHLYAYNPLECSTTVYIHITYACNRSEYYSSIDANNKHVH